MCGLSLTPFICFCNLHTFSKYFLNLDSYYYYTFFFIVETSVTDSLGYYIPFSHLYICLTISHSSCIFGRLWNFVNNFLRYQKLVLDSFNYTKYKYKCTYTSRPEKSNSEIIRYIFDDYDPKTPKPPFIQILIYILRVCVICVMR